MRSGRQIGLALASVFAAGSLLTACSGSSGGGEANATPTPPSVAASQAQIKSNWETFFDATKPQAVRLALLQGADNPGLQQTLKAQAKNPQAKDTSAKVTKVVAVPATSWASPNEPEATVTYNILGKHNAVLLPGATGIAVYVNGNWVVATRTFCSLLELGAKDPNAPIPGCTT